MALLMPSFILRGVTPSVAAASIISFSARMASNPRVFRVHPVCTSAVPLLASKKVKIEFPDETLFVRVRKKVLGSNPPHLLHRQAAFLMTECTNKVDMGVFFDRLDIKDTYFSWFIVAELHIWMVGARLMSEECADCQKVRNLMLQYFWEDCEARAKAVARMPSRDRSDALLDLSEEFRAAVAIYDEGILGDDMALANALWRRFFLCREGIDAEHLELLVKYVRRTMSALDHVTLTDLVVTGKIKWLPLVEGR